MYTPNFDKNRDLIEKDPSFIAYLKKKQWTYH